jgi:hypothetical protein
MHKPIPENNDIMDNFHVSVVARSRGTLVRALELIMASRGRQVTGYSIDPKKGLTLYWTQASPDAQPMPYTMSNSTLADFVLGWMESIKSEGRAAWAAYAGEDRHSDGVWYEYGWEIAPSKDFYGICTIKPTWALVGK